jgi:hypothetical protein
MVLSSGMRRHVAIVGTDVSEGHSTCIIRVTSLNEVETMLVLTSNQNML